MKTCSFAVFAFLLGFALFGCAPQKYVSHQAPRSRRTHHVVTPGSHTPVYPVLGHSGCFVAYNSQHDDWSYYYFLNNQYVYSGSSSYAPPLSSTSPVAAVSDAALASEPVSSSSGIPESPGAVEVSATTAVESVSPSEISTWEGEGGNLGPVAATESVSDTSSGSDTSSSSDSGSSSTSDSGSSGGGDSGGGSSD